MQIPLRLLYLLFWLSCFLTKSYSNNTLPDGFVFLTDIDPTIIESPRYASKDNFIGIPLPGYNTKKIICTKTAALALKNAHLEFQVHGFNLVVYDAYRPQTTVNFFLQWSKDPTDQINKKLYYPSINKKDVFKLGYVSEKSGHSRGSTFDLTLIPIEQKLKPISISYRMLKNNKIVPFLDDNTVDMGSSFDLLDPISHHQTPLISEEQSKMRELLRQVMKKHGFNDLQEEWWHYTLNNEPFPDTYFDFSVTQFSATK